MSGRGAILTIVERDELLTGAPVVNVKPATSTDRGQRGGQIGMTGSPTLVRGDLVVITTSKAARRAAEDDGETIGISTCEQSANGTFGLAPSPPALPADCRSLVEIGRNNRETAPCVGNGFVCDIA